MPKDTNPVVVVSNENIGTDIAGNVNTPSYPSASNTQSSNVDINDPTQGTGNNQVPTLITPIIETFVKPKGSGASVVAEPELGTPIVKDAPIQDEQPSQAVPSTSNPIKALLNNLPPFLGGGGGGAGAGAGEEEATPSVTKKPNYVLYGGLLLAIIIAYKLLSKKDKKAN